MLNEDPLGGDLQLAWATTIHLFQLPDGLC